MSYGLTSDGFVIKRLPVIKEEWQEAFRAAFPGITVTDDSVTGQIIGIASAREATIWEMAELVYLAYTIAAAEGFSLDNLAQLTGTVRKPATKTRVVAILEGNQGTVVPDGTQLSIANTGEIFEQIGDITITKNNVLRNMISVATALQSTTYTVTLDGTPYVSAASSGSATGDDLKQDIITKICDAINGGQSKVTATDNSDLTLTIEVDDKETFYTVDLDANLSLDEIWTPATYDAANTGVILANAGTLTVIETPVSGLNATDNLLDGVLGSALETDPALRIRRKEDLSIAGAGTVEAIKARIAQEVASVTVVKVFENRTDATVSGRPPHSIECVVYGGANQDIGDKIWEVKPAGIQTHGNIPVDVTDSEGNNQVMKFTRPTAKYAWVDVEITKNSEETFPTDGLNQIRNNILDFGLAEYSIGDDFILQKLFAPVYEVAGIATAIIKIAITAEADPVTGTTDGTSASKLIDSGAEFLTSTSGGKVVAGMTAKNTTDVTEATIVSVDSDTQLTLDADIFTTGENYSLEKNLQASNIVIGETAVLAWNIDRITAWETP